MGELRRELGLFEVTVYGVGVILGAGIYAILGEATGLTGPSVVFSFLLAAGTAALTGLSYAEMASRFPKEEGDYLYVREGLESKRLSELTALMRLFVGVTSAAAVALAFGGYLRSFAPVPIIPAAIAVVLACGAVNLWGIRASARVNVLFTALEVLGLVIVVALGVTHWGAVDVTATPRGLDGLVAAAFLTFFAYMGFESIVNISEETEDASTVIPRAIVISILVSTALYALVAVSAVSVVDWQLLGASDSPLAIVALQGHGPAAFSIVSGIALFATANTVLMILISTSRVLYGVSKTEYQSFPAVFSRVHPTRRIPHVAIALVTAVAVGLTFVGDIGIVAGWANLFLLLVFALVNAALLRIRYTRSPTTGFRAPLNVGRLSLTALGGLVTSLLLAGYYVVTSLVSA